MHDSLDALKLDGEVRQALQTWSHKTRLCNMHTERDLALVKQASPMKNPLAERLAAAGLLTQWLRSHRAAGGVDPRGAPKASDLVDAGVGLARGTKRARPSRPSAARGVFTYIAENIETGLNKEEAITEKRRLAGEFYRLPLHERAVYIHDEALVAGERHELADGGPQISKGERYDINIGDKLWGLSSYDTPLQLHHLSFVLQKESPAGCGPGMRNFVGPLRDKFAARLYVEDSETDGIDPAAKFDAYTPCGVAHPGLCPVLTPDIYLRGVQLMKSFEKLVRDAGSEGAYYRCRGAPTDLQLFCVAGYVRRSLGEVVVMSDVVQVGEELHLVRVGEGTLSDPLLCSEIAQRFLKQDGPLTSFLVSRCKIGRIRDSLWKVRLLGYGDEVELFGVTQFKSAPAEAAKKKAKLGEIERGFKNLMGGQRRPPEQRSFSGRSLPGAEYRRRVYHADDVDSVNEGTDSDNDADEDALPHDESHDESVDEGSDEGDASEGRASSAAPDGDITPGADIVHPGGSAASDGDITPGPDIHPDPGNSPLPGGDITPGADIHPGGSPRPAGVEPPQPDEGPADGGAGHALPLEGGADVVPDPPLVPAAPAGDDGDGPWLVYRNDDRLGVPIGKVVWNRAGKSLDAHCFKHKDSHLACAFNRTIHVGSPKVPKGRPLAFLILWIRTQDHPDCACRKDHFDARLGKGVFVGPFNHAARLELRQRLEVDAYWAAARAKERDPLPGEPLEPIALP